MKYRPEIDGLRTMAVLPVVFFHSGLSGFSGGFIGVDIFFVISGFLITTLLEEELREGRFSIVGFYERRARRILPAIFFYLILTTIFAALLFLPSFFIDYAKSMVSVALFISNFYFWKFSGYFEDSALLRPLLHTWSLSVEEQFYIFMPLAMWLLNRWTGGLRLAVFAAVAAASFALSVYATDVAPTANFFLLPTRCWELLLGALLAIWGRQSTLPNPANNLLAIAGLSAILFAVFTYSAATPFPGLSAALPCMGAVILIYTGGEQHSIVARLLSTRPFVFTGRISYSLYLSHWPIAVFLRYVTLREPGVLDAIFIIVSSYILASFSWWFVEGPFRGKAIISSRGGVFASAALGLFAAFTVAYGTIAANGFPNRFPAFEAQTEMLHLKKQQTAAAGDVQTWRNDKCFFENGDEFKNWKPENCQLTKTSGDAALLWGDSYAAHYVPGIVANAEQTSLQIYEYTYAGCPPILAYYSYARPSCQQFNRNVLNLIKTLNVKHVILSGRWVDLRLRGLDLLQDTISTLKAMGVDVTVIGQSPMFVTDVRVIGFEKATLGETSSSWPTIIEPNFNEQLKAAAKGADFIDPIINLCPGGTCNYIIDGQFLYFDSGHFSDFGSDIVVKQYFPFGHKSPMETEGIQNVAN
ncbi:acyltransferase family protein [Rhizobium mayense]|uniref:Acyltransferase family protein n=1 Tax=Rhizobium mayense TaxID=1312184 RepID=A0ABT7K4V7_9HYPH|nr:acyltransferase family protein [Rhizobium mayense]MDL2403172.1 acyltransferase family protein [Rhizobium mayense]